MDPDLDFQSANLHAKANNTEHRTSEISTQRLIIRRGQSFNISLRFKGRVFNQRTDNITFIVETGNKYQEPYRERITFSLSTINSKTDWSASVTSSSDNSVQISVFPPANATIGLHNLKVQINNQRLNISHLLGEFIALFNPWCPEDSVFLENEEERKEYVMNENGFVYVGNADWIVQQSWNYGQFDEDILEICLQILDRSQSHIKDPQKDYFRRHDPVYISRVVSAMINGNDDNGVLQGRWDGNYDLGTNPSMWNGSCSILRKWASMGFHPVKYGQCWVFAAVFCTVMRGLGIPTRVVTNFDSAHDTNGNLFVDEYHDIRGNLIKNESKDSIWNFHVWDESWMARKDLPPGYDGWQVLDSTPQETSDGIFCCGPTSVRAIKEGDIHLNYDAPFVFAEVNADIVSWVVQPDLSHKEKIYRDTKQIGRFISTKSVGNNVRFDITSNYKYKEGSEQERSVFKKALASLNGNRMNGPNSNASSSMENNRIDVNSSNPPLRDTGIEFKLKLVESPVIGQDINFLLVALNLAVEIKKININISVQSMRNDGRPFDLVWQETGFIQLGPNEEKMFPYQVPYSKYRRYLTDNNLLKVSTLGELRDIGNKLLVERNITLATPDIQIEVTGNAMVNKPFNVTITFNNPLSEELHDCVLRLEGQGLTYGFIEIKLGTIKTHHSMRIHVELTPYQNGQKILHANFHSDKLKLIKAFKDIRVFSSYV
ncbi:protein-glutamine gamma-glutamyltransferase 5-like [Bombina bombina]|uniref:protein-glutamine gamma-glutamyltransferase 5-like n=1 Tax=Bombina bombina TaxID=8345 RepID=UPI00235A932B|nr:protein-glutamine gamma-glutamyltransferase 5-like [Bombina bombina]